MLLCPMSFWPTAIFGHALALRTYARGRSVRYRSEWQLRSPTMENQHFQSQMDQEQNQEQRLLQNDPGQRSGDLCQKFGEIKLRRGNPMDAHGSDEKTPVHHKSEQSPRRWYTSAQSQETWPIESTSCLVYEAFFFATRTRSWKETRTSTQGLAQIQYIVIQG